MEIRPYRILNGALGEPRTALETIEFEVAK
jgi:hypothetical protein